MSSSKKTVEDFGLNQLEKITLANELLSVELLNLGATIYSIQMPDQDGTIDDIVLGYPEWVSYISNKDFLGCVAGRYANRIANANFNLGGVNYKVSANEGSNCLHGGFEGIHKKFYDISELTENSVTFSSSSPDGEDGFPGNLQFSIKYTLESDTLEINYTASSDKDTVINLTNHSYFNLAGHGGGSVLDHEIEIHADKYLPVDKDLIPKDIEPVENSPFDYREANEIAYTLRAPHEQIALCGGIDHNLILRNNDIKSCAAKVSHMYTGRFMEVYTTEPGLQFYTANHIDNMAGKDGAHYGKYPAFCLETQHYPNSPNRPDFPSTTLVAGEVYSSQTNYRFGISS
ncbi:MAG: galactose mutarotase [Lentisphaeraceae bacterium]|nr:galactose mutarotase [Lentisphaeraceae bacterium]